MDYIAFQPQSNRASWRFTAEITDIDDVLVDITNYPIVFQIRDKNGNAILTASTANGKIAVVALGVFQWFFTVTDMAGLWAQTYQTGLTIASPDGSETVQLSVGPLPIVDGIVP